MGVVHKLKQEVIDFIVTQKEENPQLGCRSLASAASERFQTEVSKSSVNAVIKNANLSSPLGRKPRSGTSEKKFKIPREKKEQIFPAIKSQTPPLAPLPPPGIPKPEKPLPIFPKQLVVPTKPVASTKKIVDRGVFFDGMGAFFLKAAEWELNGPSILGELLNKYLNRERNQNMDIHMIGQVLLFLEVFGLHNLEDLKRYEGKGLWALNGISEPIDEEVLRKAINLDGLNTFLLKVASEKLQIFSEINYFKLVLENRMEICIDSRFNMTWSYNVHSEITMAVNKVMTILSSKLINNIQPMILRTALNEERFTAQFYEMLGAFENIPGKRIVKIALFDSQNEEFAQFNILPDKRRTFIIGLHHSQAEFVALASQDTGKVHPFFLSELEKEIYYSELTTTLPYEELIGKTLSLRTFFLRESAGAAPHWAVLTNIPDGESSPQEIISEYVLHWPYFEQGLQDLKLRYGTLYEGINFKKGSGFLPETSKSSDSYDFLDGVQDIYPCVRSLLYDVNRYCQKHFYPPQYEKLDFNTIKNRFYELPGYVRKIKNTLCVHLTPPPHYLYWEDLEFAIRRINESAITNAAGLRLLISADPRF